MAFALFRSHRWMRKPVAAAVGLCLAGAAFGQSPGQTVVVTGTSPVERSSVGGFGDTPNARAPFSITTLSDPALVDAGVMRLGDLTRASPAVSDAYNAEGYWALLAIRGYPLDPRFNLRRDGLPISGETVLALESLQSVDILEGTSGIQAGTSAPGGLLNLVVKRPAGTIRRAGFAWQQSGSVTAKADLGDDAGGLGWRLNLASERLAPQTRSAVGSRHLAALALSWQTSPQTRLDAEVEISHQSQPSVPGFSLLGDRLPDARTVDPRTNLNNQPWSLPVVFDGTTASLRWQQQLTADWRFTAHAQTQRLRTDDRLAYPFGCSAEGRYDRYCSDGSYDVYDFRSDGEHRVSEALNLELQGRVDSGGLRHQISGGVLASRFQARLQPRVDDATVVGTGKIDGSGLIPSLPALGMLPNTDRSERSTEAFLRDHIEWGPDWSLWAGLRQTRLQRGSVRNDGSEAIAYGQRFTTPWLALSRRIDNDLLAYASWGQGVESDVVPNKANFANPGQPLPALKSRQTELGLKHDDAAQSWTVTAFDISRPRANDLCDAVGICVHAVDGHQNHRGVEASLRWRSGAWRFAVGGMALHARIIGAADPASNGKQPTNVPAQTLKGQIDHDLGAVPGLTVFAATTLESRRMVLPDNSLAIPGWTRWDLGARYTQRVAATTLTWRAAVDNATDRRAWRESPFQYGHAYLFPLPPRSWRLSVQADL